MPISIADLPDETAHVTQLVRDEVVAVMGDDLVAMWLHGGTTFTDRPRRRGDLDLFAVVASLAAAERDRRVWQDDATSRPARVKAAIESASRDHGFSIDLTVILEQEAGGGEPPSHAFRQRRHLNDWPITRGHLLAGQYVHLYGRHPDDLVVPPTKVELELALDRELEHLERHVYEGDASDPYEATYAMWNGSRILYSLETGSPVISKRSAGMWALEHLDEEWHDAIRAASRSYDGEASDDDNELLRVTMPRFVAMVRSRLPLTEAREGPPRWS